ncbi:MAG: sugar ABC transporter ATP-binding protein [Spirochaetota bacterium]
MSRSEIALRTNAVSKVYPGTVALDGVSFEVHRGRVNALVGENGAGKSTLMKILAGVEYPSQGSLLVDEQEVTFRTPLEAMAVGVGIIYQELDLCPNLSVVDNVFLAHEVVRGGRIDRRDQRRRTVELIERLEHDIDPDSLVGDLRVGDQQIVAIIKALAQDVRILIMDEPTSSLSTQEVDVLFRVIAELKSHGISIIYISHRLEEILSIGDTITVLRDGRLVARDEVSNVGVRWIVEKMIGRQESSLFTRTAFQVGEPLMRVRDLCLPKVGGGHLVDHVSFELRRGEILGLYGLMGAGRTEVLEALMGTHNIATGEVEVEGEVLRANDVPSRIDAGLVLVPEDRKSDGFVPTLSVAHNMILASLRRYLGRSRLFLMRRREKKAVREMIEKLRIRVADPEQIITSLSGGNQQKVVIAKGLLTNPRILLLDEPSRGVDVGAKSEIFKIVDELAAQGYGVLYVSSELKEITQMADRILVMANGRLTGVFEREDATEDALVEASFNGTEALGRGSKAEVATDGAV